MEVIRIIGIRLCQVLLVSLRGRLPCRASMGYAGRQRIVRVINSDADDRRVARRKKRTGVPLLRKNRFHLRPECSLLGRDNSAESATKARSIACRWRGIVAGGPNVLLTLIIADEERGVAVTRIRTVEIDRTVCSRI